VFTKEFGQPHDPVLGVEVVVLGDLTTRWQATSLFGHSPKMTAKLDLFESAGLLRQVRVGVGTLLLARV